MKGLQPLFFFFSERSNTFNSVICLVGEGSTLATACTSVGEERERATQQNSCTLWTHSSRAGGAVFEASICAGCFITEQRCIQRDKKGRNSGESGVKRCSSSPPFISAAHVEFHYMDLKTCECRLFLWPWHHWWSRGDRVWCTVLFPRCPRCFFSSFFNAVAFVDLWSTNVIDVSHIGVYFVSFWTVLTIC